MEGVGVLYSLTKHYGLQPVRSMRIGIGFGSNLGDRLANLLAARAKVVALPFIGEPIVSAPMYESIPVDCGESAPDFFNSMVEVDLLESTDVNDLLTALRQIETQLGRPSRRPKNASRPVDLDILYAGNLALHTPTLTLPHPRLHQRRFVLAPLVNVRPDLILPGQLSSVATLLRELNDPSEVKLTMGSW